MATLMINGESYEIEADDDMPLLWAIRDLVGQTGTKFGCGMGLCGACSVHLDGKLARSCITPVSAAKDKAITTIEGRASRSSFDSIVAEVALDDGDIRVDRVCCAVDCGFAVNPAIVKMQMESGIAYGLSAALAEEITLEQGRVKQGNFDTYPILRPDQMPLVEVEIINSGEPLGGIGEPGTPPIASAVCNALFTLSGQRVRNLPLSQYTFYGL